jgi:tetratricopeptide (TPR) repeat protein
MFPVISKTLSVRKAAQEWICVEFNFRSRGFSEGRGGFIMRVILLLLFAGIISAAPVRSLEFWEKQTDIYLDENDVHNTFASLHNALDLASSRDDKVRLLNKLAYLHFKLLGHSYDAEGYYKQVLQMDPYNFDAGMGIGDLCFSRGEWLLAQDWYEKVRNNLKRVNPEDLRLSPAYAGIAACFYELAKNSEAQYYYEKALELTPKDPVLLNNYANIYFDLKEALKAREIYEKALTVSDDSYIQAPPTLRGDALQAYYEKQGKRYEELMRYFHEVKERKSAAWYGKLLLSDFQVAHSNLAVTYYMMKQYELAEMHFKRALELDPEDPAVMSNLANLYFDLRQTERAKYLLTRALSFKDEATYHNNLAIMARFTKETKRAGVHYSKAILRKKDYWNARKNGAFFHKRSLPIDEARVVEDPFEMKPGEGIKHRVLLTPSRFAESYNCQGSNCN